MGRKYISARVLQRERKIYLQDLKSILKRKHKLLPNLLFFQYDLGLFRQQF